MDRLSALIHVVIPFQGGDCEDTAVFNEGVQHLSVCDDIPTVNNEFVTSDLHP